MVRSTLLRGQTKDGGGNLTDLSYFMLKAEEDFQSAGKMEVGGELRVCYAVTTTYTCRIPVPKWWRNVISGADKRLRTLMSEEQKFEFQNLFIQELWKEGMILSNRGYQPYAGYIQVEMGVIDEFYSKERMKAFYKRAYAKFSELRELFRECITLPKDLRYKK